MGPFDVLVVEDAVERAHDEHLFSFRVRLHVGELGSGETLHGAAVRSPGGARGASPHALGVAGGRGGRGHRRLRHANPHQVTRPPAVTGRSLPPGAPT